MRPPFRLVEGIVSTDTVEVLRQLLGRAKKGELGTWTCAHDPKKYDSPLVFVQDDTVYLIGRRNLTETTIPARVNPTLSTHVPSSPNSRLNAVVTRI